jgi:1-deoxy-D-xylulose-5-phosphate reductoisomerase
MSSHNVSILGSTGSIGRSTLEVLEGFTTNGEEVRVAALVAGRSIELLAEQVRRWRPQLAVVGDETLLSDLSARLADLDGATELAAGPEAIVRAATHPEADLVVNALVGSAGLVPTVRALESGRRVALANKETLVVGGTLVTGLADSPDEQGRPRLMPVDSEHSALLQAIGEHPDEEVLRLILTASGGPFRETPIEEFEGITARQALRHPTWNMGRKITIDSATLMNKGLEVIEAHWLFRLPLDRIGVVVHPQSIVHSLVEFVDGNILAHFSVPDMRLPIQYALTYPHRKPIVAGTRLDIEDLGRLQFEPPDEERFPALQLCRDAVTVGGTLPAVLNAANEVAVAAFLSEDVSFKDIPVCIRMVMESHHPVESPDLDDLVQAGRWATEYAHQTIGSMAREG